MESLVILGSDIISPSVIAFAAGVTAVPSRSGLNVPGAGISSTHDIPAIGNWV